MIEEGDWRKGRVKVRNVSANEGLGVDVGKGTGRQKTERERE